MDTVAARYQTCDAAGPVFDLWTSIKGVFIFWGLNFRYDISKRILLFSNISIGIMTKPIWQMGVNFRDESNKLN